MLVTTADIVPGTQVQVLGLVRGNVVWTTHAGKDFLAGFKTMVGGEITGYTTMTNDARAIAENRMVEQAQSLGADAVVATRFGESSVLAGSIEMLCYGTAVKFV
ncbi:MAG: YbjQ family protein [Eggerthellaceae bacterium]|nr:YbjQ family protein [Eggerthellaceae bacterium]